MLLTYEVRMRNYLWRMKENAREAVHDFLTDEQGDTNMISIVIILVIVIALAAIFRKNIAAMVKAMWENISKNVKDATGQDVNITNDFS